MQKVVFVKSDDDAAASGDKGGAASAAHPVTVDASTLQGKLLFGYQGWFDAPGSNSPTNGGKGGWVHWAGNVSPNATDCGFDLWPAMDEYPAKFPTPDLHARTADATASGAAGGQPMALFSSGVQSTQDVHFRWMREYGLDGVFIQRFVCGRQDTPISDYGKLEDQMLLSAIR